MDVNAEKRALKLIEEESGKHFDPEVVEVFCGRSDEGSNTNCLATLSLCDNLTLRMQIYS